jgi:hypothetical protein
MATIGLDRLFYAKITEAPNGNETYGVPNVIWITTGARL